MVEIVNLQIADEKRWGGLVSSIAPSCHQKLLFQDFVFMPGEPRPDPDEQGNPIGKLLAKMIKAADEAADTPPEPLDFSGELADFRVTRTVEDSLAKIADRSNSYVSSGSSTPPATERVEAQPERRSRAVRRRRTKRKVQR